MISSVRGFSYSWRVLYSAMGILAMLSPSAFANGEIGMFDCSHLLTFGVFREFKDTDYFLRASVVNGTVVWPNEQDICPDTLYEESVKLASWSA